MVIKLFTIFRIDTSHNSYIDLRKKFIDLTVQNIYYFLKTIKLISKKI